MIIYEFKTVCCPSSCSRLLFFSISSWSSAENISRLIINTTFSSWTLSYPLTRLLLVISNLPVNFNGVQGQLWFFFSQAFLLFSPFKLHAGQQPLVTLLFLRHHAALILCLSGVYFSCSGAVFWENWITSSVAAASSHNPDTQCSVAQPSSKIEIQQCVCSYTGQNCCPTFSMSAFILLSLPLCRFSSTWTNIHVFLITDILSTNMDFSDYWHW